MKDLKASELKRYKVRAPLETQIGFNTFFPGSKVSSFEFPIEKAILKTIVSEIGKKSTRISISCYNGEMMRAVLPSEVYLIRDYLQNADESLVWQYNPVEEKLRSSGFKAFTQKNFDMNSFVLHMHEFTGNLPPIKEAYSKKMQKNRGMFYSRGTIGEWKFIHIYVKNPFPWEILQKVAYKEFGTNLVQVFFNQETKKEHPKEFVIWYHPNAVPLL
ncbi:MAG: hypothetical protein ACI4VH_03525 [Clostridia bacterium]